MDLLILSTNFLLIVEVKNISGTLIFDPEFNQLIRLNHEKEEGFLDPRIQVERQKKLLKKWLSTEFNLHNLPIETIVLISNPSTIIKTTSRKIQVAQKVIHNGKLLIKIDELASLYTNEIITKQALKKIAKQLMRKNEILDYNVLDINELKASDLVVGVHCKECSWIPMTRYHGTWKCPQCKCEDKEGHTLTLTDYALLIGPTITNRELRKFLSIESDNVAKRLLNSLNLPTTGKTKGKSYNLAPLLKK